MYLTLVYCTLYQDPVLMITEIIAMCIKPMAYSMTSYIWQSGNCSCLGNMLSTWIRGSTKYLENMH